MTTTYEAEARRRMMAPSFTRFLAVTAQRRVRNMTEATGALKAIIPGIKTLADLRVGTEPGNAWERLVKHHTSWITERPMA